MYGECVVYDQLPAMATTRVPTDRYPQSSFLVVSPGALAPSGRPPAIHPHGVVYYHSRNATGAHPHFKACTAVSARVPPGVWSVGWAFRGPQICHAHVRPSKSAGPRDPRIVAAASPRSRRQPLSNLRGISHGVASPHYFLSSTPPPPSPQRYSGSSWTAHATHHPTMT